MFQNKTAIVTGASSGIGYEIAKGLAQNMAKVIAVARREEKLKDLTKEFDNVLPVTLDVREDLTPLNNARTFLN